MGTARLRASALALVAAMVVPIALIAAPTAAHADTSSTVSNYPAPYNIAYVCGIATGPDGALWFTNFHGDSIGRMTTAGTLTTFTGTGISSPCGITTGPDGALWFLNTGSNTTDASIGRITTAGAVTNYTDPTIASFSQEYPGSITTGPDGALWFTNSRNDSIGRITTGGTVSNFTGTGINGPRAITSGPDGALWFTNNASIGRITTAGAVTTFTKTGVTDPIGITAGPDGALWFTNGANATGSIGRITTAGVIALHTNAAIQGPTGITAGPDGALWFTNISSNTIGRITTSGTVSHFDDNLINGPVGIAPGPDGALWVTTYDSVWRVSTAGSLIRYRAPGSQEPLAITAGPDGAVWFTNFGNDSIGRIDPTTGVQASYTGTGIASPSGITAGPDGALWFTNNGSEADGEQDSIGRITTAGVVTSYPDASISSPSGITAGPDGALWFTNTGNNSIGRITTAGVVTNYTDPSISSPNGIAAGPDGALWFTNGGNNSIGRITTAGVVTNYTSIWVSTPVGITSGPDGALWFTNIGNNADWVGRITTAGTITHVNAVIANSISSGPDGALWLTDQADGLVGRVTTDGIFTSYFDPTINRPYAIAAGADDAMWFTNFGNNSIGRITVPTTGFTVPDPPTDVSATASDQSVTVSFTAPANDGGLVITGYSVSCISSDGGASGSFAGPALTLIAVGSLTDGHTYTCTVTATNAVGPSLPSAASNAVVPLGLPDRPTDVVATAGDASVSVAFTPPVNDGGSPITSYGATCHSTDGGVIGNASGATSPVVVSALTNGHLYFCTVTATNVVGAGSVSELSTGVVPGASAAQVPDSPTNVSATFATALGNTSASVSFTAPANNGGAVITGYTAKCLSSDGGDPGSGFDVASPVSAMGLTLGHTYQCTVTAANAVGTSAPSAASNTFGAATVSVAPANLIATRGDGSASVSFTAPTNTGGSAISQYTVSCTSSGGGASGSASSATSPISVSGLTNGGTYQCTATATNAVGTSGLSGPSNAFVPATVPAAPGAPLAVLHGTTGAKVSWSAPSNGGLSITRYVAARSPGSATVTVSGSATSATFSNLAPGSYKFRVRASSAIGDGAWSDWSNTVKIASSQHGQSGPSRSGYWMLGHDGHVYAFGAGAFGSAPGGAVAIAPRRDGAGYWVTDALGNVSHFGAAGDHGGHPALRAGEQVSTISATPSGNGYWLFTNRGRAFAYGDAHFFGDMSAAVLNGPIVASVATPTGKGYFMVGSDGGVFSFGDARFHGSTGNLHLNKPIVGISATPDNRGYWLLASDGGVFAFDAPFRGSMGSAALNKPVNGLVAFGNGYLDGRIRRGSVRLLQQGVPRQPREQPADGAHHRHRRVHHNRLTRLAPAARGRGPRAAFLVSDPGAAR